MGIDAIAPISIEVGPAMAAAGQPPSADFMTAMTEGIAGVEGDLVQADRQLLALAAGEDIPVHDLMITMERARMSLTLMTEIRNRAVEAYQELTRMQL